VYHIDPQSSRLTKLTDEIKKPNGLCFSPDYRTLYVADTAPTHFPGEKAKIISWTVQNNGSRLTNRREFATLDTGFHDGIRPMSTGISGAAPASGARASMGSMSMRRMARGSAGS
jgi:gluconolactonase